MYLSSTPWPRLRSLRWYLLLVPMVWFFLLYSLSAVHGRSFPERLWVTGLWLIQGVMISYIVIMSLRFLLRMYQQHRRTVFEPVPAHLHLAILPIYKEPFDVVCRTLEYLERQSLDSKRFLAVFIGFEERSPHIESFRKQLFDRFGNSFCLLSTTVHPFGLPGEVPGKCSNGRWLAMYAEKEARRMMPELGVDRMIIDSLDADTLYHRNMLAAISEDFFRLPEQERHEAIWQGGQFFNWGLAQSSFMTRLTAIYRTLWMIGFNIPMGAHCMSTFSSSMKLCRDNDYFSAEYQMDDMNYYVGCMATTGGRLSLRPVYLPVICGPTSGENPYMELREWAVQGHRWSIGAFEIFHVVLMRSEELGHKQTLLLGLKIFFMFLFFQSVMALCTILSFSVWDHGLLHADTHFLWVILTMMPMLFSIWALAVDMMVVRLLDLTEERVPWVHNLWHLLLSPLVMVCYNLLSIFALHHLMIKGRNICVHNPSDKQNLEKERPMSGNSLK